jgi:thioredoxin 1
MPLEIESLQQYNEKLAEFKDKLVVIDFHAVWCGPCKMIAPQLEAMAKEFAAEIEVFKVDVDEAEDVAMKEAIKCMPTFLFYKGEKKVAEFSGADAKALRNKILELK